MSYAKHWVFTEQQYTYVFCKCIYRKAIYNELQEISEDPNPQCWWGGAGKMLIFTSLVGSTRTSWECAPTGAGTQELLEQRTMCGFVTYQVKTNFLPEQKKKPVYFPHSNCNFSSQVTRQRLLPSVHSLRQGSGVQWSCAPGISFLAAGNSQCLWPIGSCNKQWWDWWYL